MPSKKGLFSYFLSLHAGEKAIWERKQDSSAKTSRLEQKMEKIWQKTRNCIFNYLKDLKLAFEVHKFCTRATLVLKFCSSSCNRSSATHTHTHRKVGGGSTDLLYVEMIFFYLCLQTSYKKLIFILSMFYFYF